MFTFDTPESQGGLYVNLKSFQGAQLPAAAPERRERGGAAHAHTTKASRSVALRRAARRPRGTGVPRRLRPVRAQVSARTRSRWTTSAQARAPRAAKDACFCVHAARHASPASRGAAPASARRASSLSADAGQPLYLHQKWTRVPKPPKENEQGAPTKLAIGVEARAPATSAPPRVAPPSRAPRVVARRSRRPRTRFGPYMRWAPPPPTRVCSAHRARAGRLLHERGGLRHREGARARAHALPARPPPPQQPACAEFADTCRRLAPQRARAVPEPGAA